MNTINHSYGEIQEKKAQVEHSQTERFIIFKALYVP